MNDKNFYDYMLFSSVCDKNEYELVLTLLFMKEVQTHLWFRYVDRIKKELKKIDCEKPYVNVLRNSRTLTDFMVNVPVARELLLKDVETFMQNRGVK